MPVGGDHRTLGFDLAEHGVVGDGRGIALVPACELDAGPSCVSLRRPLRETQQVGKPFANNPTVVPGSNEVASLYCLSSIADSPRGSSKLMPMRIVEQHIWIGRRRPGVPPNEPRAAMALLTPGSSRR